MKDLITEARELCADATPGPWESGNYGAVCLKSGFKLGNIEGSGNAAFIARSRTLIPELCDALEKATAKNDELIRELSELARESVKRDMALARLEAEVEHAITATRWIPVAERLPERNDKILAYTPPKPGYAELYEVTRGFMAQLGKRSGITNWQPLPAPPEEGTEHERD